MIHEKSKEEGLFWRDACPGTPQTLVTQQMHKQLASNFVTHEVQKSFSTSVAYSDRLISPTADTKSCMSLQRQALHSMMEALKTRYARCSASLPCSQNHQCARCSASRPYMLMLACYIWQAWPDVAGWPAGPTDVPPPPHAALADLAGWPGPVVCTSTCTAIPQCHAAHCA